MIYILRNGQKEGPASTEQVVESIRTGEYQLSDLAWREGMTEWLPIHSMPDVVDLVLPPLPVTQGQNSQTTLPPVPTSASSLPPGPLPQIAIPTAVNKFKIAIITVPAEKKDAILNAIRVALPGVDPAVANALVEPMSMHRINCDSQVEAEYIGGMLERAGATINTVPVDKPQESPVTDRPKAAVQTESDKLRIPAILLCLFLGAFGLHAFYAGRKKQGIALVILFLTAFFSASLGFARFGALCFVLISVLLIITSFRIALGYYKDGEGRNITKWV